jgi:hypothetical protein
MTDDAKDPVLVVGAGPVGLVAAAHLADRGVEFLVLEAGDAPAASIREWGHVRLFTPWRYLTDPVADRLLAEAGWTLPPEDDHPTGAEFVARYLDPLAARQEIAPRIRTGVRVHRIEGPAGSAEGGGSLTVHAEARSPNRGRRPLRIRARAVLDASGSWRTPNPLGGRGTPLPEEVDDPRIVRGIPDVAGAEAPGYRGRRILVAGSGHSALHLLRELLRLQAGDPATEVTWLLRRPLAGRVFGGGDADALPARGAIGQGVREGVATGRITVEDRFHVHRMEEAPGGALHVVDEDPHRRIGPFDRILVATGFHPDPGPTRGLRLELDPRLAAPRRLAPLVDPRLHSCGSVAPHGWRELAHPEAGYFAVGALSYGRAPTFLLRTGYEQVRSVVAHLAGDEKAAEARAWELPETGVCVTDEPLAALSGCCGPAGGGCGC